MKSKLYYGLIMLLALLSSIALTAVSATPITMSFGSNQEYHPGGLATVEFSSTDTLLTGWGFAVLGDPFNGYKGWFMNTKEDMYNPPTLHSACTSSSSTLTVATLVVNTRESAGKGVFLDVLINTNIPANTKFSCTIRWNVELTPGTDTMISSRFNAIADATIAGTQPTVRRANPDGWTLTFTHTGTSNFSFSNFSLEKVELKQDLNKLALGYLDRSTVDITLTNLQKNKVIPIAFYMAFDPAVVPPGTDPNSLVDHDHTLAIFNEIGPVCSTNQQVRIYRASTTQLYIVTGDETQSTAQVTCKIPFSMYAFNNIQLLPSVDIEKWPVSSTTIIAYDPYRPAVMPTEQNSFTLTNPKFPAPYQYKDISIVNDYLITQFKVTLPSTSTTFTASGIQQIAQGTDFSTKKLLDGAISYYSTKHITTFTPKPALATTLEWTAGSNNSFQATITTVNPNQLVYVIIAYPLSALTTPLSSTFMISYSFTTDTTTKPFVFPMFYQPPVVMVPDSQVEIATFTTEQYSINYKLQYNTYNTKLFSPTTKVTLSAVNFYMEPNLETRDITTANITPECTFTTLTSKRGDKPELETEIRARTTLQDIDIHSNRYYHLTMSDAQLDDQFNLKCTYKIIVTKKNWFPAPVDLLNYVIIRDKSSMFRSTYGFPQIIDWKYFWFPLETGPRVYMANEGRPNFCFVVVGPNPGQNGITSQQTLDTWIDDFLTIARSAPVIDESKSNNWFVNQDITKEKIHWTWGLSYYMNRGHIDEKNGKFGINKINMFNNQGTNQANPGAHVMALSTAQTMLWVCTPNDKDPPIVKGSLTNPTAWQNTLIVEAFRASKQYAIHDIGVNDAVDRLGYYADDRLIYFEGEDFVPVLNVAMGMPCLTTPQAQAQGIDICYKGISTSWMDLPGEYLLWTRLYKDLTYSVKPAITEWTQIENFGLDLFTLKPSHTENCTNPTDCNPDVECEEGDDDCGKQEEDEEPSSSGSSHHVSLFGIVVGALVIIFM